jgi:pyruvyl transferase EpsI
MRKNLFKNIRTKYKILLRCLKYSYEIKKDIDRNPHKRNIFIFDIPEHGNLGDHAIAVAEKKFIEDFTQNTLVHEIPQEISMVSVKLLKPLIKNSIILITGGGNMGTLWFHHEVLYRKIVKAYPNNRVIIFPETIYYENSDWGTIEFNKSKNIYNAHNDLHICARENKSYQIMKEAYKNVNVIEVPDIVAYLKCDNKNQKRKGVLLCLREDKESIINYDIRKKIFELAESNFDTVNLTNTVINEDVAIKDRHMKLNKKLDEFRESELVVTDRLHGMIFATITSTPCIALNNKSGKVKGVYEWIKYNNYVCVIDDVSKLYFEIQSLKKIDDVEYDKDSLVNEWKKIARLIN